MITQSIIPSKLFSDIRFGVLEGALVVLQLLYEVLHLGGVFDVGGPKLGAVLTNKPRQLIVSVVNEMGLNINKTN
jgi:hypothetical protein